MKTILLLLNLFVSPGDTVVFDHGNDLYMNYDSLGMGIYEIKNNLPDGVYIIMDKYGGDVRIKRQQIVLKDSIIIENVEYFENPFFMGISEQGDTVSGYRFENPPPVQRKYTLSPGHIEEFIEYYENGIIRSVEILNRNLQVQPLISEAWYSEDEIPELVLRKDSISDTYLIEYYYDTGEINIKGQFDEFNRPNGIWTYFYKNGNKKSEGPVCAECAGKLWRPWILNFSIKAEGEWIYYNEDGSIREIIDKGKNSR